MPRFDTSGCRILGPEADHVEVAEVRNDEEQLDQLRLKYEEDWHVAASIDPKIYWIGVYHANGKLVAALGHIYYASEKKVMITDLLADGSRWGKIGTYVLLNWLHRTCPKGTILLGQCAAENTLQQAFMEQYGGKCVTVLYRKVI